MGKFIDRLNALIVEDSETQRFMRDALLKFGVPYSSADKPQQIAFKFLMLKNDILSKETALDKMPLSKAKPLAEQKLVNALKSKGVSFPSEKVVGFNGRAILNAIDSDCEVKGFSLKNTFKGALKGASWIAEKSGVPVVSNVGAVSSALINKQEETKKIEAANKEGERIMRMKQARKSEFSDEALLFYLQNNADVGRAAASSNDRLQFAYEHWKTHGFKEKRKGTPIEFETMKIAVQNNDAAQNKIEKAQSLPVMTASSGKWVSIILVGVVITVLFKKFIKK